MSQQLGQCDPVSCTQDQRDDVLWTALHRESHSLSVLTESVQSTVSPRSLLLSPPICPVTARGHHLDDASDDRMYVILSPCLSVSVCLCLSLCLPLSLCLCLSPSGATMRADFVQFLLVCVCVCCLLYTSPSPRDLFISRMPSSA